MSCIGKNIKKIRALKKISQTEFAKIFDLTRGTIGAYEEERAEPKIDTIVQLADYFGLSIDALINKELTVSDLYSLDVLKEKLNQAHSFKKTEDSAYRKAGMALVRVDKHPEYIVNCKSRDFVQQLPYIEFPVNYTGVARAFEVRGNDMEYHRRGLHQGDILLCLQSPIDEKKGREGKVFVTVMDAKIIVRRLKSCTAAALYFTADDPNHEGLLILKTDILELWEVKGVYSTCLSPPERLDEQVMLIEKQIQHLAREIADLKRAK